MKTFRVYIIICIASDRFYKILIRLTDAVVVFTGSHRISMGHYTPTLYTHYYTYLYIHSVIYVTHSLLYTRPVNTQYIPTYTLHIYIQ